MWSLENWFLLPASKFIQVRFSQNVQIHNTIASIYDTPWHLLKLQIKGSSLFYGQF
ncbi:hypothetical protein I79_020588 [Cricetulus griseus]|uniref:Uncharacterized protein n=1 Tax=Cricetulus griseus TaxID=10029 RepID=G3IAG5_CRIGR|nr:hypothetical protein I79_020588 [Cricetulus griseus]